MYSLFAIHVKFSKLDLIPKDYIGAMYAAFVTIFVFDNHEIRWLHRDACQQLWDLVYTIVYPIVYAHRYISFGCWLEKNSYRIKVIFHGHCIHTDSVNEASVPVEWPWASIH